MIGAGKVQSKIIGILITFFDIMFNLFSGTQYVFTSLNVIKTLLYSCMRSWFNAGSRDLVYKQGNIS